MGKLNVLKKLFAEKGNPVEKSGVANNGIKGGKRIVSRRGNTAVSLVPASQFLFISGKSVDRHFIRCYEYKVVKLFLSSNDH